MKLLQRFKISTKLTVLVLIPVLVLTTLVLSATVTLRQVNAGVDRIYLDRVVPLKSLKQIADDYAVLVIDVVNKANAGLLTAEQAHASLEETRERIESRWQTYLQTQLTDEEQRLADEAQRLFRAANVRIAELSAFLQGQRGDIAGELAAYDGPLYAVIDPISLKVGELVELQLRVASAERERAHALYLQARLMFIVLGVVAVVGTMFLGWAMYRSIIGQLHWLRATMLHIAEKSDLSIDATSSSRSEIGDIARTFELMLVQLRELIRQIGESADGLSAASTQMAGNLSVVREKTQHQRAETEQVASAVQQMSASAQEVAMNTASAAQSAQQAKALAEQGNQQVAESVNAIARLASTVGEAANVVDSLEDDAVSIGQVLDVIQGVAEQTNLLALNAAIEAARAGEAGRGFAVVADEVRTLASRTQTSAHEIQDVVQRLQQRSREAASEMRGSREQVDDSVTLVSSTGQALEQITQAVNTITAMMTQIATAAEQQTAVSHAISQGVIAISDATHHTSEQMSDLDAGGRSLAQLAGQLREQALSFRI